MSDRYQASASDLNAVRAVCEEYGFCLIKGVLNAGDLERLLAGMRAATRAAGGPPLSDLLGLPELRHIYFDSRLLDIARCLLGPNLVYDGEGNVNFEETIGAYALNPYAELHCDARGMPHDLKTHWSSPTDSVYRAYRFGIYFHDYSVASGALKVIVGSHRGDPATFKDKRLLNAGIGDRIVGDSQINYPKTTHPLYNLPSQPGDVVVWNLRTFHAAGAKLFAADTSFAIHPSAEANIAAQAPGLFAPVPGPRNALFFDYAAPCEEIDLYIKSRAQPSMAGVDPLLERRSDDPAAVALAREHGIVLRHDTLITALAIALAFNNTPKPVRKLDTAAAHMMAVRLNTLLRTHQEYSAYFPLFDRARFEKAENSNASLASAVNDILAALRPAS